MTWTRPAFATVPAGCRVTYGEDRAAACLEYTERNGIDISADHYPVGQVAAA
ncbi:MbtH family NRPS accessory protein [Mycobacterium decipiens]|uniref:MbtH family NRPS accessory protein n=1 Tax=Mycobacterium decipiens TaxID=1430326 RepID=UPI000E5CF3DA|nr:MbtH family NRPS accessory protein [Mycobacterium decipiens]